MTRSISGFARCWGWRTWRQAPEFLTNADRIANRDEMTRRLTEATLQPEQGPTFWPPARQGVPAGPINDLAEVFADPQVIARGMRTETDGVPGVRPPFRFSDAEVAPHRPAPKLGEDGRWPVGLTA
jgi:crotonobetainyl-CoA:carnitine CoA-transferase CaiB-like acyl-CoA transferase